MIYDAENTFFWHKALKSTTTASSDVVKTGTGDAACPLDLYIQVTGASGGMTVKLETSKNGRHGQPGYTGNVYRSERWSGKSQTAIWGFRLFTIELYRRCGPYIR